MTWRFLTAAFLAAYALGLTTCPADEQPAKKPDAKSESASIEYVPLDAPEGMSQAVIVPDVPLVYTRQLFPLDRAGKLIGEGSVDKQIEQTLDNLEAVLKDAGSGPDKLIRLNVYALAPATITRVRELLAKRLLPSVRPAITSVETPLAHRGAMVALDAVAAGSGDDKEVVRKRCEAVAGEQNVADVAVLPRGDIAYISGQAAEAGLTESATNVSMSVLMRTLGHLKISPAQIVQVKVFLRPASSAEAVQQEVQKFFPDQTAPPMVFVEWLAPVPVEIELVCHLPASDEAKEPLEFYTPPEFRPSNTFSRVALLRTDPQIFISGQYASKPSRGQPQADLVFGQLQKILDETGSDMRHLVKATYYVADHDAARWVDRTRPKIFDPNRPPAASKLTVHAVGMEGRTMTIDMIAIKADQ